MNKFLILLLGIILISCGRKSIDKSLNSSDEFKVGFTMVTPEQSGITFRNDIVETRYVHHLEWDAIYYGGGVGVGDFNDDGLQDLFFCGNQVDDALYLNKGHFEFEDISHKSGINKNSGWSTGVSIIDIDADGDLDIYVCRSSWKMDDEDQNARANQLFINNGDLTFTESAKAYGLDNIGYSTQATFLDYDHDGDLDMFLLNAPSNNLSQKIKYVKDGFPDYTTDKFFINEDSKFVESSNNLGLKAFSYGLGVVASDINHDGWVDLYVANDYERPDYLYINQKDGTFKNELNDRIKHTSYTAMGCDVSDINNDGFVDIAVLDMQASDHVRGKTNMPSMQPETFWKFVAQGYNYQYMSNVLQLNGGVGYFSDIAQLAGMASTDWSWSVLLADFDNDGYRDIYVSNGVNKDVQNNDFTAEFERKNKAKEKIDLFEFSKEVPSNTLENFIYNNNGDLTFSNKTEEWGMDQESFSFGASYADLDNDGDLDLIVNNNNDFPFLYKNQANGNYLKLSFIGPSENIFSFGVKAIAYYDGETHYSELTPVRGYQSSVETNLHFGLGKVQIVDSIVVIFPDGKTIIDKNIDANQVITYNYLKAQNRKPNVYKLEKPIFTNISDYSGVDFLHHENHYDDYQNQVLLPHSQTKLGPFMAKGDINGDGAEDLYIGGAMGQSGVIYLQMEGKFVKSSNQLLESHAKFEDMGSVFFDADLDGDLDLYVVSGGGVGDNYHDRLYLNNGVGVFAYSQNSLPKNNFNGSCVKVIDYDLDGDLDLFVGGKVTPEKYPYPAYSQLLINEGGIFTDETNRIAPGLELIGMVNDAVWSDINVDGKVDLMVVGEWMSPTIFIQTPEGNLLADQLLNNQWANLKGWWFHINEGDFNNDGKPDFVVGNFGMNSKYKPSLKKPLKIYSSDFDDNGTNDVILCKAYKGKYVPVRGRQCSSEQLPDVEQKFETYHAFANASIDQVIGSPIKNGLNTEVTEFHSGIIMSGKLGHTFIPFDNLAQISPIMSSLIKDFNGDGTLDILIAGNLFDTEVETVRHDGSNGLFLKGTTEGFVPLRVLESGFYAPLNVKSIIDVELNNQMHTVLVGSNDNRVTAFRYKSN